MQSKRKTSLTERAYNYVSHLLMQGRLAPGDKLSERSLSTECGVSRVPMRAAIARLTEEGVLFQKRQSGTYVATFTRQDLVEVYEVREAIECRQVQVAVPAMDDDIRAKYLAFARAEHEACNRFLESGKPLLVGKAEQDLVSNDYAQHRILLRQAGNSYAEKIVLAAHRRNLFYGLHSHLRNPEHILRVRNDHDLLAAAVEARNPAAAADALRQHIRHSMEDALRQFDATHGSRPVTSASAS